MATATIRVKGLNELVRVFGKLDKQLRRDLQRELQEAARPVASLAQQKLSSFPGAAVSGIRPRVKGSTAIVEQRKGPVTGRRGDFGSIVMRRALVPARAEREPEVRKGIDDMLDKLAGNAGF